MRIRIRNTEKSTTFYSRDPQHFTVKIHNILLYGSTIFYRTDRQHFAWSCRNSFHFTNFVGPPLLTYYYGFASFCKILLDLRNLAGVCWSISFYHIVSDPFHLAGIGLIYLILQDIVGSASLANFIFNVKSPNKVCSWISIWIRRNNTDSKSKSATLPNNVDKTI